MKKKIDITKNLLFVLFNGGCDHAFVSSEKDSFYDKGDKYQKKMAIHLNKENSQVVMFESDQDYDDTQIILDEELPSVAKDGNYKKYNYKLLAVYNTINDLDDE